MHLQKWHFPMLFIKIQDCLKFYYTWHLDLTILTVFTLISKLVKTSKKHTKVWWIATKVTFQIQPYLCFPNLQKCIGDITLYWMLISDVWKHFMKETGTGCPNKLGFRNYGRLSKTCEDYRTIKDYWRLYRRLSKTIEDDWRLSKTIEDYRRLLKTRGRSSTRLLENSTRSNQFF